jgi:tRNA nucleotidyltransferase (CCA-adding enzyme)
VGIASQAPYTWPMEVFLVGGAVRDALLGLPVQDRDWVVVGATPEELVSQGFVPVGKDFPVFIHPQTGEEYALARTERKSARGYRGFVVHAAPDVTLEQDLARRDLTINSIAAPAHSAWARGQFDAKSEVFIDPYDGRGDIQRKVLRHVTDAFREDPVRILRVARLAARFPDFSVAPETTRLMQDMVVDGEVDALVSERVWQELARGLMTSQPSRLFDVLRACGALEKLLPEVDRLWGVPQVAEHHPEIDTGVHLMMVMDMSAQLDAPLTVRFACLCHDLGKGTTPADVLPRHIGHEARSARLLKALCERLRVPNDCRELADIVAREHGNIHRSGELNAAALVRLLERCDAFRKPARFDEALLACECDARGRLGHKDAAYPQRRRLMQALKAAQSVDTSVVASAAQDAGADGRQIGEKVHVARVAAVNAWLNTDRPQAPG